MVTALQLPVFTTFCYIIEIALSPLTASVASPAVQSVFEFPLYVLFLFSLRTKDLSESSLVFLESLSWVRNHSFGVSPLKPIEKLHVISGFTNELDLTCHRQNSYDEKLFSL